MVEIGVRVKTYLEYAQKLTWTDLEMIFFFVRFCSQNSEKDVYKIINLYKGVKYL